MPVRRRSVARRTIRGANLSGLDLTGLDLREADLSLADLVRRLAARTPGSTAPTLRETDLGDADLRGARAWTRVDLSAARLRRTRLDLAGAVLLAELHGAVVEP